ELDCFNYIPALFNKVYNILLPYHLSVDLYPLSEINQVWRCIQACAITCLLENGGKHMRYGSFAIGPCNMDATKLSMWMTEILIHTKCIVKVVLICRCPATLVHRKL